MLFFYLILALGISFLCSVMESVILSVSMSFIYLKEREGNHNAMRLKRIKLNIDRPLAAILSLNTVAHTIGAAGVGAEATRIFGESYFGIISAILTLLILIFSEIIPKTIGALYWRTLALPAARIIHFFIIITFPLVKLSELITKMFSKGKVHHSVSREEIAILASLGSDEGVFDELESKAIINLISLRGIKVRDIMTPRTVLVAAPETTTSKTFADNNSYLQFSRIPIYENNIDEISGYVLKQDILEDLLKNKNDQHLTSRKREIVSCYETVSIPKLFEKLILKKEHLALVINEYGSTEGIVTLEDIIETILGREILDERDNEIDMQQLARRRWQTKIKQLSQRK